VKQAQRLELIRSRSVRRTSTCSCRHPVLPPDRRRSDMALNHLERFLAELEPDARFVDAVRSLPGVFAAHAAVRVEQVPFAFAIATSAETSPPEQRLYLLFRPIGTARGPLLSALQGVMRDEDLLRVLRVFRKRSCSGSRSGPPGRADLSETWANCRTSPRSRSSGLRVACGRAQEEARQTADHRLTGARPRRLRGHRHGQAGGRELNFSSDVDLMYVYTADGETEGRPERTVR